MPPCEYKEIAATPCEDMGVPNAEWVSTDTSSNSICGSSVSESANFDASDLEDSPCLLSLQPYGHTSRNSGVGFLSLCSDVQLEVLSFLKPAEARSVLATCHKLRRLLLSNDALFVWTRWCRAQWPVLSNNATAETLRFRNDAYLPTALSSRSIPSKPNLSVLLAMASWAHPTCINDKTLVSDPHRSRQGEGAVLREFTQNGLPVVQFMGEVGTGDRSIRADQPLSRPRGGGIKQQSRHYKHKRSIEPAPPLPTDNGDVVTEAQQQHRRGIRHMLHIHKPIKSPFSQPFVAPYMSSADQVHLTPRLVSYFEVDILGRDETQEPSALERASSTSTTATDCVAIGLSINSFKFRSRMPGWDRYSYGYHGDDGGIFHGSGTAFKQFGPRFGEGDVVGCGVDYVCGGIFFTLNGKFLGYGWTGLDLNFLPYDGLYPTVGVDTNSPVSCNFGDRPFQFDLHPFVKHHEDIVKESLDSLVGETTIMSPIRSRKHFRALERFVPKHQRKHKTNHLISV